MDNGKNYQLSIGNYQLMKDSGVDWLGDIPAHWNIEKGKWIWKREKRPVRPEDEIVTAFRDGTVTLRKNRREDGFTNSIFEIGYQGIRKGDLVIHGMDAFAGAIGVSDSDGKSTPVYSACTPVKDANPYYYAYLLKEMSRTGYIQSLARGIRERSTEFKYPQFADLLYPLPPLAEQTAIADFLDRKTAQIDQFVALKAQTIALLQEQKTALINAAVTGKLIMDNGQLTMDNSQLSIVNSQLKKDSGIEWLGEIPAHWEVMNIKYVLRRIIDTEHKTAPFFDNGEYFVCRTSNVKGGQLVMTDARYTDIEGYREWTRRGKPEPGDIIFTREAPAGEACVVPDDMTVILGQRTVLFKVNHEMLNEKFGVYSIYGGLASHYIMLLSQGSTVAHFNMSDIRNIPMLIPPLDEQHQIVAHIEQATAKIEQAIAQAQQQIDLIKEYRESLISQAVTGKIKVIDNG